MKDYLQGVLSKDEIYFILGIIRKTSFKFIRNYTKIQNNELLYLDSDEIPEELLIDEKSTNLVDKILETRILRDISDLKPYSKYEKEKIVKTLEKLALEACLKNFITPLTFNEKLVVFLLYVESYEVNEVATLLNVDRTTIWRRDKSIKNKIKKVKEKMKNERGPI